jgi:hypothetical protein
VPVIRREDSEEDTLNLHDLPAAEADSSDADSLFVAEGGGQRSKRTRTTTINSSSAESSSEAESIEPRAKRRKDADPLQDEEEGDDKKKMEMDTTYDGFAIYGLVLCLVVKRKDLIPKGPVKTAGQVMMEEWITSTQMPPPEADD